MFMQDASLPKPYDVKALVRNLEQVFETCNIARLNEPTYQFITNHMGLRDQGARYCFQAIFEDLRYFCLRLQSGDNSINLNRTLGLAQQYETDRKFHQKYGEAYTRSIVQAIRQMVATTRQYEPRIIAVFDRRDQIWDLLEAKQVLEKYGFEVPVDLKAELECEEWYKT